MLVTKRKKFPELKALSSVLSVPSVVQAPQATTWVFY